MAGARQALNRRYHFIGVGGIGMSGVARLFLHRGAQVSGSDLLATAITRELAKAGVKIFTGHAAGNIQGADCVVYSSAVSADNPEIIEARRLGIPLAKRAQALAQLMRDKTVITVSGSHGKTTTTSLVSCLLLEAGLEPTVVIGGILKNIEANARIGQGEFFVAEADESDGSFLYYHPEYSIVTNIDHEHLDHYGTFENELAAFARFFERTKQSGCLICCGDDPNLKRLARAGKHRHILFGLDRSNDIYAERISFDGLRCEFDCFYKDKCAGRFSLALGGRHNISNALAVVVLGMELGVGLEAIKKALSNYQGARRRLEIKFQDKVTILVDDYAHHPSEIKATLAALKNLARPRMIAVFQPHRYTRTKLLLDQFAGAFAEADYIIITDIYPAGERPLDGVSAEAVFKKIKERFKDKPAHYVPKDKIRGHVLAILKSGDLVITLGAGDITKVGDELAQDLKRKSPAERAA